MKTVTSLILIIIATLQTHRAWAHSPYYSSTESFSANGQDDITLKLLNGDGIFFADPMRAVVVDQHGNLLAASPMSTALTLVCTITAPQRTCFAYDELSQVIYEPKPDLWQDAGTIEKDGRPIAYPEDGMTDFGFAQRSATATEVVRAELAGAVKSLPSTTIGIAWWMLFWLLILPIVWRLFGRGRRLGLVSIVLRLLTAALMMVLTAYGWLLSPYSAFYLVLVSMAGAFVARLVTSLRNRSHPVTAFHP